MFQIYKIICLKTTLTRNTKEQEFWIAYCLKLYFGKLISFEHQSRSKTNIDNHKVKINQLN